MKRAAVILGSSIVLLLGAESASAIPIYDIQYTTAPGGESPMVGQTVTITGLVTAEGYAFGGDYYFVQDDNPPWSGIRIDDPDRAVAEGDEVTLTGAVAEISGMTVIQNVSSFEILSSGNVFYDPMSVATGSLAAEQYEGCLMMVEDVTVTNPGPGNDDFQVDDGSGSCWIGSEAEWYFWPEMDQELAYVVGVVNYLGGQFKLEPRLTRDITQPGRLRTLQWVQQVRYSDLIALRDSSYAIGDTVEISGIVTMPTGLSYAGAGVKFLYQDHHGGPWSGIMSYDPDSSVFPVLIEGDSVRVVGRVSEYLSAPSIMTEMFITEPITILGTGLPVPEEPVLPTGDLRWPTTAEQWGTVMVKVQNAWVVENNLPYNEWSVTDGSGKVNVDDDSDSLSGFVRPPVGTQIQEIRGWVYNHFGYYTDSTTYKLEPLYLSDIIIGSGPPDILNVVRDPGVPQGGDPVYLVCEITDNSLVLNAWVYYRVNNGSLQQAALEFTGGFYWEGEIPEMSAGDWVDYYIVAEDDSGNFGIEPPDTTLMMFCYPVTVGDVLAMSDVQFTPWPAGNSPFTGYQVTVEGVVTGDTSVYSNWEAYVFQDADAPWSGMFVSWISDQLGRGQTVRITGTVTEEDPDYTFKWGGLTKLIEVDTVIVTGTGARTPLNVSTWDLSEENPDVESYEGVLVTVQNVQVTSLNQYDWTVDDGSGGCLMDDDACSLDSMFAAITPASTFERVTGFFNYSFGTYKIELRDSADFAGFVGVKDVPPLAPCEFSLAPNFPNPFNASTRITYTLPRTLSVKVVIYNLMGQQVQTLVDGTQMAGKHTAVWRGKDALGHLVSSGVYFYRIKAGDYIESRKMVLLK